MWQKIIGFVLAFLMKKSQNMCRGDMRKLQLLGGSIEPIMQHSVIAVQVTFPY